MNLFLESSFARVWMRALLALQSQTRGASCVSSNPSSATCQLWDLGRFLSLSVPSVSHLSGGLLTGPSRGVWVSRNPWEAECTVPGQGSSANAGNADTPETSASLCGHRMDGSTCFISRLPGQATSSECKGLKSTFQGPLLPGSSSPWTPANLTPWYS